MPGCRTAAVQLITSTDRALVQRMLKLREYLDVIIPRGGEGLIRMTVENATVPVIETGAGVCHTYIDRSADAEMAVQIAYNAKVRRPTICNALDTLLVHRDIAASWLPQMAAAWAGRGSRFMPMPSRRGAPRAPARLCAGVGRRLGQRVSVPGRGGEGRRQSRRSARHIRTHGSGHSEAIVTSDDQAAAPLPERGGCGGGLRERQHAVHRRRRVRSGGRGRHLDPEAPRAGADGPARAHDL